MFKYWLIVLFIIQTLSVTAQKYAFEKIPDVPYGFNIVQDAQGYIWFNDEQGLHKHNGISSYKLTEEDGLPRDLLVQNLTIDNKGHVWVASRKYGVAVIRPDTITFYNKKNGLLSNEVHKFYKDRQQRIWVVTPEGLSLWTGTKFKHYKFKISYEYNVLWEDQQGKILFFYSGSSHILEFTAKYEFKPRHRSILDSLNTKKIITTTTDQKGNVWFLEFPKTLIKYDGQKLVKMAVPNAVKDRGYNHLLVDYQNNLWIGTKQGAIKYDGLNFTRFTKNEGFTDGQIFQMYEDQERVLWMMTFGGVYKYYGEQLMHWDKIGELSSPMVFAFSEDTREGNMWIGTIQKGVFKLKDNKVVERLTSGNGLINSKIYMIYQDKNQAIWIGTRDGLNRYDGQKFTTFTTKDGLTKNAVNIVREDAQGRLWMGHWQGGVTVYDGKSFRKIAGLEEYKVSALHIDSQQRVWVGANKGLFVLENGKWRRFSEKEGLIYDDINGIAEDQQGNLWLASFRGGLYLYDHQTFKCFTEKDGLPSNSIYGLLFDKKTKQLWLHSNGISKLDLKGFYKTGQFKLQTIGKTEANLGAFYKDSKGNLWFGNVGGFGRYDARHGFPKSTPQLHLTGIKLFLRKTDWHQYTDSIHYDIPYQLNLPYNQNYLTFSFAGVTSRNAAKVRYQYKLEGNDQDWSPLSTKNEMTYSNLPAGNYKFLVKALSNEGEWSKTLEYSFCIHPPFWQTTWFYITAALALVALFVTLVRWRTRRIRQQNILLEHRVEERTQEIQAQSSALKTQTEEIKAQTEELKQINERLVELDDFKQGVTGMIVHDLKNPLNSLLAHAKSPETRQSAQQMLHMVLNILDVQKLESTELQLHWDEFAINLLIKQALDQVMVLAQQKNVHFQWSEQSSFVVRADADLIQRVIINLLTNAIKHTPLNSVVYIQLEETPQQKLKLTVTDEGPGVPDNLSNKVFDKFFSSGAEKQAMIKSTGLGLTFCKLAMEAHEEAIGVVNATEKGASFWFTLPLVHKEVVIREVQHKSSETDFILTQEAKNELLPYAQLLANAQVYEMGKIKNTIDQIKADPGSLPAQWKEKMLEATFSMNQQWYDKLINLIINQLQ